ncbi:hypothetical protein POM88_030183 [Heracleum sosnowskyi]|uniref:Uncharacterized protein n=1 Tax=Heracleum sosnowskyi TaxID=360622 RepID=A0AAD8HY33_9APIA|nr:hypothetical protein POM88_030183 [Heracleum sosnowskyi]
MEIDELPLKFPPRDDNVKDASINDLITVKDHCRVLVLQYLLEEIIKAGKENSEVKWLDIVESLFWQATKLVELSNSSKGNMACVDYAKVKCIATTNPTEGIFIKGVAGTMKIRFKCMTSQYRNIGLFVLEGTVGYQNFPINWRLLRP